MCTFHQSGADIPMHDIGQGVLKINLKVFLKTVWGKKLKGACSDHVGLFCKVIAILVPQE